MMEVGFVVGELLIPVLSISPEMAEAVRQSGMDPAQLNRMTWPTGATRHAMGRFLLHQADLQALLGDNSTATTLAFKIGDLLFDQVVIRNPKPVLISEGSAAVYVIEVTDARKNWTMHFVDNLYNIHTDDKSQVYDYSSVPTTREILIELVGTIGSGLSEFDLPNDVDLMKPFEPRDLTAVGLSAAALMDKLLMFCGYVLLAYPNPNYPGAESFRYRAVKIDSGEVDAAAILTAQTNNLIGGGIYAPSSLVTYPPAGPSQWSFGPSTWMDIEVPKVIVVYFPLAASDGKSYSFNDFNFHPAPPALPTGQLSWTLERYHLLPSSAGFPPGVDGQGVPFSVFDQVWARKDADTGEIVNLADLQNRADLLATRYYQRFAAGCGDFMLMGIQQVPPYSGAQEIIWTFGDQGAITRVHGRVDDPLFGYDYRRAISPTDIYSTGLVRAIPRSDGGVLLDAPALQGSPSTIHAAIITAVYAGPVYDAEAVDGSGLMVQMKAPVNREADPPNVPWIPVDINDPCLIVEMPEKYGGNYLIAWERFFVSLCPQGVSQTFLELARGSELKRIVGAV